MYRKWLTFGLSAEQEDRFRQANLAADVAQARIWILLILAPLMAFAVDDYGFFGLAWPFYGLTALRLALVLYSVLLLKRLRAITSYRSYDRAEFAWGLSLAALTVVVTATRPHAFVAHAIVAVLAVLVTVLAIPNRFANQLALSLVYTAGETLVIAPSLATSPQAAFTSLLGMFLAVAIAVACAWQLHAWRRREFLAREREREAGVEAERQIGGRQRAEAALLEARAALATKVKERTAELQQANERLQAENQQRMRSEQSLRLEEARLDALLHLSRISEASLNEVTSFTLEQAIALTQSKIGFVGLMSEDESVYTLHAVSKDVVKECNVVGDPMQWHVVDAGIWADAIREHRTLFVNDYSKPHPRKKGLPPGHPYVERFMVVPILEGARIVALAGVGNKASDYDKADERQIFLLLSGMWGYVQKSRAKEELQKAYDQLEKKVEQRTAELAASAAALGESQQDLARAQEVGQMGWWRLDVGRNFLTWSDENHRIFGVPKGTPLTYDAFLEFIHPDDREYVDTRWQAGLRGAPYDIEHRIVVDGQVKWVREKAYLESDPAGRVLGGFGITQDITERKRAEEERERLLAELDQLNRTLEQRVEERTAQVEALAGELNRAEQRERQRLALVLHDDLQQLLYSQLMRLEMIRRLTAEWQSSVNVDAVESQLDASTQIIQRAVSLTRSLAVSLNPPALESDALEEALAWLALHMEEAHGLKVHLSALDPCRVDRPDARTLLVQIVRELLFNVVKHAGTREARVMLSRQDGAVLVCIQDDGAGFDVGAVRRRQEEQRGTGLFSIADRLALIGGRMEIESAPGQGTRITLRMPVS